MNHKIKIFDLPAQKDKNILDNVILPIQTHSNNIIEIKTGNEDLRDCDGIITSNKNNFSLGIQTADCAAICFHDNENYGIIHAGWRGLVGNIIEKMLDKFINPEIFVAPALNRFEIQKDDCYERIKNKFGEKYFDIKKVDNKEVIFFEFLKALKSILPKNTVFDSRDTSENKNLASWRRDSDGKRNYTVIYGIIDKPIIKIKLGKYKHYKGKYYEVVGVARHSETLEELVIYKALYYSEEFGENALWARPLSMFLETVEVEGEEIQRFEFIE